MKTTPSKGNLSDGHKRLLAPLPEHDAAFLSAALRRLVGFSLRDVERLAAELVAAGMLEQVTVQ